MKLTSKRKLFIKSYIKAIQGFMEKEEQGQLKKVVFYGIKVINDMPEPINTTDYMYCFDLASGIKESVALLTPNEFMNTFPIAKEFDGDKFETKDYFYTMNYINALERDTCIGKQVDPLEFLWEYHNWDVMHFSTKILRYLSGLRRAEGHLDMFEEFMASQGKDTPNTFKNSKGEPMYIRNGKPEKVQVTPTGNLKVVR